MKTVFFESLRYKLITKNDFYYGSCPDIRIQCATRCCNQNRATCLLVCTRHKVYVLLRCDMMMQIYVVILRYETLNIWKYTRDMPTLKKSTQKCIRYLPIYILDIPKYIRYILNYVRDIVEYMRDIPKYISDLPKYIRVKLKYIRDIPKYVRHVTYIEEYRRYTKICETYIAE